MKDRTVGIEVEIPGVTSDSIHKVLRDVQYHIANDGSIRSQELRMVDGVCIVPMRNKRNNYIYPSGSSVSERGMGAEIVTSPYTYNEALEVMDKVAFYFGHIPPTPRASIHIHVDIANSSWKLTQNLFRWFCIMEPILFRLSALGVEHRGTQFYNGMRQDHNFARPLTMPIAIDYRDSYDTTRKPLVNLDRLLTAKTASEMMAAWGRLDMYYSNMGHYMPHRVHALNPTKIPVQGTIEWRFCNGVYRHARKALEFVYGMHRLAEVGPPDVYKSAYQQSTHVWKLNDPSLKALKMNVDDVSTMLGVDIAPIWGKEWVRPAVDRNRYSHYNNDLIWDISAREIVNIENNRGTVDEGFDDFPLYERYS